jgi:hypothetical protein
VARADAARARAGDDPGMVTPAVTEISRGTSHPARRKRT